MGSFRASFFLVLMIVGITFFVLFLMGRFNEEAVQRDEELDDPRFRSGTPEYTVIQDFQKKPDNLDIEQMESLDFMQNTQKHLINNADMNVEMVNGPEEIPLVRKIIVVENGSEKPDLNFTAEVVHVSSCKLGRPSNMSYIDFMTALFQVHRDQVNTLIVFDKFDPKDVVDHMEYVEAFADERWDAVAFEPKECEAVQQLCTSVDDNGLNINRLIKASKFPALIVNWRYAAKFLQVLQENAVLSDATDWSGVIPQTLHQLQRSDTWIGISSDEYDLVQPPSARRSVAVCIMLDEAEYRYLVRFEQSIFRNFLKLHEIDIHVWSNLKLPKETTDGWHRFVHPSLEKYTPYQHLLAEKSVLKRYDDVFLFDVKTVCARVITDEDMFRIQELPGVGLLSTENVFGGNAKKLFKLLSKSTSEIEASLDHLQKSYPVHKHYVESRALMTEKTAFLYP